MYRFEGTLTDLLNLWFVVHRNQIVLPSGIRNWEIRNKSFLCSVIKGLTKQNQEKSYFCATKFSGLGGALEDGGGDNSWNSGELCWVQLFSVLLLVIHSSKDRIYILHINNYSVFLPWPLSFKKKKIDVRSPTLTSGFLIWLLYFGVLGRK